MGDRPGISEERPRARVTVFEYCLAGYAPAMPIQRAAAESVADGHLVSVTDALYHTLSRFRQLSVRLRRSAHVRQRRDVHAEDILLRDKIAPYPSLAASELHISLIRTG